MNIEEPSSFSKYSFIANSEQVLCRKVEKNPLTGSEKDFEIWYLLFVEILYHRITTYLLYHGLASLLL